MRELKIEATVCRYAKTLGWETYKWVSPNNRGVPDRIFIRQGQVVFIEFKAPGKAPTVLQQKIIARLVNAGVDVHVIDDIKRGKILIDKLTGVK